MERNGTLLRIGDVAGMTNVSIHTLRYWENVFGGVINPCRSKGGQRTYCERDLEMIVEIKRLLKEEGYSIGGARRILKNVGGDGRSCVTCREMAFDWSHIAQEVTELIRKKLSKLDSNQEEKS